MDKDPNKRGVSDAHNHHHAQKRRQRRDTTKGGKSHAEKPGDGKFYLYGLHTVRHALENPQRTKITLYGTKNAFSRLDRDLAALNVTIEEKLPRELDRMVGSDAVHQGIVLETKPLLPKSLEELNDASLVLVLDQVTDPHNVGAILRSAVALGAGAVITTARHSAAESGVMAKSASGALDMIDHIEVRNLSATLESLNSAGYQTIGLDSSGEHPLEQAIQPGKIALLMGAEGKGLRQKTRDTCTTLSRLDMPGRIKSLNVSNAAALALYVARRALDQSGSS